MSRELQALPPACPRWLHGPGAPLLLCQGDLCRLWPLAAAPGQGWAVPGAVAAVARRAGLASSGCLWPAGTRGTRWPLSLPFSFSPWPGFPAAAYGPVAAAAVAAARGSGRGARGRANPQSAGSGKSSVGILCGCSSPHHFSDFPHTYPGDLKKTNQNQKN